MAKEIAQQLNADPEIIFEGQEKKHFWDALGGKAPYFDEKVLKQNENVLPPRLFQISNASGNISVERSDWPDGCSHEPVYLGCDLTLRFPSLHTLLSSRKSQERARRRAQRT